MRIIIGNDHTAVELKQEVLRHLAEKHGIAGADHGAQDRHGPEYPDYARDIADRLTSGEFDLGILLCGTGAGMCIAANKKRGIRAVVCSEPYTAQLSREHNDANVLCIGARVVGVELAKLIVDAFLAAEFEGGRHARRVAKITGMEGS